MTLFRLIQSDIRANGGRTALLTISYRIAFKLGSSKSIFAKALFLLYKIYYRIVVNMLFGFDVDYRTRIGPGLAVYHGQSIVIGEYVVIGSNVKLRQCTTIGNKGSGDSASPVIGDNVNIGAHAVIIGDINIGDGAAIGAGAIVTKDIPPGGLAIGPTAKIT